LTVTVVGHTEKLVGKIMLSWKGSKCDFAALIHVCCSFLYFYTTFFQTNYYYRSRLSINTDLFLHGSLYGSLNTFIVSEVCITKPASNVWHF